ncbi:MAG TPA: immunoglobulin domain-containing protein [Candidatus Angelobacter sp.]|nr:immunoglobulin domain-containing protein [Candidatus Angelobacter sp.]
MKPELNEKANWLKKALCCLAFLGFLTTNCLAQLGGPPSIIAQPLGVSVLDGGSAVFTGAALSLTSATFTWYVNGKVVTDGTVVTLAGVSTLTIPHATRGDRGNYTLKVSNASGSVTSNPATLIVVEDIVFTGLGVVTGTLGYDITNGCHFQFVKPANSNCVVEASTDLRNWTPVYTNTTSSTNVNYADGASTNMPMRYYRVRVQ